MPAQRGDAGANENVHESVLGQSSHVLFSHVLFLADERGLVAQHCMIAKLEPGSTWID